MVDVFSRQLSIMMFDDTRLAVPLKQVAMIERTARIQPELATGQAVGGIRIRDQSYAVYVLSQRFALLPELPMQRTFCVCLNANENQRYLSIACDTVTSVTLDQTSVMQPLPECLQYTGTPLRALCYHDQQFVLASTADALTAYIASKE